METDTVVPPAEERGESPKMPERLAREALLSFHERMTERFAHLLATVEDGNIPVPHLTWTVAEVGAHVLSSLRGYRNGVTGGAPAWCETPHGQNENEGLLRLAPEREPATLAANIIEAGESFREACRERPGPTLRWHGGVDAPWAGVVGALAGEVMLHGWDIAVASSQPWPISASDAELYLASSLFVTPFMVDQDKAAGFNATFELRARRGSSTTLEFRDGSLTVRSGRPAHADCRVVVEPVAYCLAVMGRIPGWRPAVTGKMIVYGRRPWLGLRMRSLIHRV